MPLPPSHITRALLTGVLLASCASPTAVEPLSVSIRRITFTTAEEAAAWPARPQVLGGENVLVRGRAYPGCGTARATAVGRGDLVGVEIFVDDDRVCPAVIGSWMPFEATVSGLTPARYRVRVVVAGIEARVEDTVAISAP